MTYAENKARRLLQIEKSIPILGPRHQAGLAASQKPVAVARDQVVAPIEPRGGQHREERCSPPWPAEGLGYGKRRPGLDQALRMVAPVP